MNLLQFTLYQVLLVCSFHVSQSTKPRRFFENLGRIHDAIHELTNVGELPAATVEGARTLEREIERALERPHRNRQERFGPGPGSEPGYNDQQPAEGGGGGPERPERPFRIFPGDPRFGAMRPGQFRRGGGRWRGRGFRRRGGPHRNNWNPNNDPNNYNDPNANHNDTATANEDEYYEDGNSTDSNDQYDNNYYQPTPAPHRPPGGHPRPNGNHQPNGNHPPPSRPHNQPNGYSTHTTSSYSYSSSSSFSSGSSGSSSGSSSSSSSSSSSGSSSGSSSSSSSSAYHPPSNNYQTSPSVTRRPAVSSTTPSSNEWESDRPIVKDKSLVNAEKICGLRSAPKIVGGKDTKPNTWIWMAALIKNDGQNYCGGTLITSYHILTAAHCLEGQVPRDMFVRLGEYDFGRESSSTAVDHEVDYFVIHTYYDKFTHVNDIAILKLKEPAQFTHFIRPVCLPKKRKDYANEVGTVVGYGSSEYGSGNAAPPRLREVSVPIWKSDACAEAYGQNFSSGQMCAGFKEGGRDSCQGDSGGPLMLQGPKQKYEIIGIVSFGIGCGRPGYPGVYTKVNKYLDWIISNVN